MPKEIKLYISSVWNIPPSSSSLSLKLLLSFKIYFSLSRKLHPFVSKANRMTSSFERRYTYILLSLFLFTCYVWLFATPWTATHQAPLSTISWSLLRFMSIESVMLSNHLILCHPFLLSLQSFPESESFLMGRLFSSGGQSIAASASESLSLSTYPSIYLCIFLPELEHLCPGTGSIFVLLICVCLL